MIHGYNDDQHTSDVYHHAIPVCSSCTCDETLTILIVNNVVLQRAILTTYTWSIIVCKHCINLDWVASEACLQMAALKVSYPSFID